MGHFVCTLFRSMMKLLFILALAFPLALVGASNPPPFQISEQMRYTNIDYHNFVDSLAWTNAFQWANCSTGALDLDLLASMQAQLTAKLSSITTSTFRQCDRLSAACYDCENGAANVSADTIDTLILAKLEGQDNNMLDSVSDTVDTVTYTLLYNVMTPVVTASLACRANPECYPCSYATTIYGTLQGKRKLTFKLTAGGLLVDRINTGARFTYFSSAEAGVKVFSAINGQQLVPDSIMDNFSLVGEFCVTPKGITIKGIRPGMKFLTLN